jgi:hypothetical protein
MRIMEVDGAPAAAPVKKAPAEWLRGVIGRPVAVRLTSGSVIRGELRRPERRAGGGERPVAVKGASFVAYRSFASS